MKKIAFDLDNTLCTGTSPYTESKPIPEMIKLVNQLHKEGNYIIIFTARGMGSAKSTQEAINRYWYFTYNQLKNWGIKFDKLIMGKPDYNLLICDKAINSRQIKTKEDVYNFLQAVNNNGGKLNGIIKVIKWLKKSNIILSVSFLIQKWFM